MKFAAALITILTFGAFLNAQQTSLLGEDGKTVKPQKSAEIAVIEPSTGSKEVIIVKEDVVPVKEKTGLKASGTAQKAAKKAEPKKETAKPAAAPAAAVKPAEAKPAAAKPAEVKPAAAKAAEVKKEAAKPAGVKPAAAAKPADVKPAAAKPAEVKPAVAKPAEAKPAVAAKAPEAKPAAAKPAEVKPAAAKPAEAKPAVAAKPAAAKTAEVKKEAVKPAEAKPAAPAQPEAGGFMVGKKHAVSRGDTLWDLSRKYYRDPFKWGKIYNANISTVKNPDRIYPAEELVIPDIEEEVKPEQEPAETAEAAAPEEVVQEEMLEAARADEIPLAAVPAVNAVAAPAAVAGAAAAIKAAAPKLAEQFDDIDTAALSEEMPEDMKEWQTNVKIVPDSWTESGVVISKGSTEDNEFGLAFSGETVLVKVADPSNFKPGDTMNCYLKGAAALDKKGNRLGRELQKTGILEVLSLEGDVVKARVLDASTSINKGQVVKKKKAEPKIQDGRQDPREVTITAPAGY